MHFTKRVAVGLIAVGSLTVAGVGTGLATSSAKTHTLTFKGVQLKSTSPSKTTFVQAEKDVSKGKTIGYDVVTGKFDPQTHLVKGSVSVALRGGEIYASFTIAQDNSLSGKVTGGSGKYKGVSGTITGTQPKKNVEAVTITYHK